MTQTLDTLASGARGTISGYDGDPPMRLLEMGLVPGTPVEVVRLAPLGDPMDVRVRGFHLSVRKAEASRVVIEVAS
ncbi:FeoA family protein [Rubricoccus marinus]|uniref:Iron transporter n=1 Tax=Rubricoccus marinus TaxID=716817 RepID=A0A259U0Z2_9BACT|nr:FeoA family protein [Rubricoccus marinus]OZC03651.1 iron transporter [Rubricoccus marinus]